MNSATAADRARARWSAPRHPQQAVDTQLIELIQQRNAYAFEIFYDRHAHAAFALARRMVHDPARAEDVTQDAFLAAWRSCHSFRADRGSPRTWVLGITRHRAVDEIRRDGSQARVVATEQGLARLADDPELTYAQALSNEEAEVVRRALKTLPSDQREAIVLAYLGGLSHSEIAAALGLPLGTVKGRMRLGLDKLRRALARD